MTTSAVAMPPPEGLEYASKCFFPTEWHGVPLTNVTQYNHDSTIFSFGLPEGRSLDLPVCACLLLQGKDKEGNDAVRPYTPMSSNDVVGRFDLLVKVYEQGVISQYLNNLAIGSLVPFKHIPFNIKAEYPFGKKTLTMISGGTGITPMFQALQCLCLTPGDETKITLLYGNKSVDDLLLRAELDDLASKSNGRLNVVHVVGTRPDEPPIEGWDGELGWVDAAKIEKYGYPPSDDTLVMVCGLPAMYDVFCGPRTEPELKEGTVLHKLGYTTTMVAKF